MTKPKHPYRPQVGDLITWDGMCRAPGPVPFGYGVVVSVSLDSIEISVPVLDIVDLNPRWSDEVRKYGMALFNRLRPKLRWRKGVKHTTACE